MHLFNHINCYPYHEWSPVCICCYPVVQHYYPVHPAQPYRHNYEKREVQHFYNGPENGKG